MTDKATALIYFSPTHTTRRVVEGIAQGLQWPAAHLDLTLPSQAPPNLTSDFVVIGSPVYGGRLPAVMVDRLKRLRGNGIPAAIVVVYGNRAYEDALVELRDVAVEAGFNPVAAGAFIGEHSYSSAALPIAAARPDAADMAKARAFGSMIRQKLLSPPDRSELLRVPGNVPYKEIRLLSDLAPSVNVTSCIRCGNCASICPTAAIDPGDPHQTDKGTCIRCCACVKFCSTSARTMDHPQIKQVAEWLHANFGARKEPETYL